jgi:hypothetical protein
MKKTVFQNIILVAGFLCDDACSPFLWLFGHVIVAIISMTSLMLMSFYFPPRAKQS